MRTIIINVLGKEYLGLNNLFTSILNVLSLAELGVGQAMVYHMYRPIADQNSSVINALLNMYKKIYRIIGIVILVVGLLLLPFLQYLIAGDIEFINVKLIYVIFLIDTVFSYFLFAYKSSLLQAHQRADIISNVNSICTLVLNGIQIVILLIFKDYYCYIIMKPLFTLLNNVLINITTNKIYPEYKPFGKVTLEIKKEIYKKTGALLGHKIGQTVIASTDSLVISSFLGLGILAIYSNYYYIVFSVVSITAILFNGMLAGIGNKLITCSIEENYKLFKNINFMISWLVTWCSTCLLCLIQPFMEFWMGSGMLLDYSSIILIIIYYYTWQFRTTGLYFKDAAGMWNEDLLKPYVGAVLNLTANIILVKVIGINGIFISTIMSMVLVYFPWETYVIFNKMFKKSCLRYLILQIHFLCVTVLIWVVSYLLCQLVVIDGFLGIIIKGIICVFVPNILFIVIHIRKKEEYGFLLDKARIIFKR